MSTARQRRGLRGLGRLRRILRQLGPEMTKDIRDVVERGAGAILADQQTFVPKDDGKLAAALGKRISRDGLTARIGLVTPGKRRKFFYARFIEFGTKGGEVTARRAGGEPFTMQVPQRWATPFLRPSLDLNRATITGEARAAIRDVLKRVVRSGK